MEKLIDVVKQALSYDEASGEFTWLERPASQFNTEISARKWNGRFKGKLAGSLTTNGYVHIRLSGKTWKAHQLVWLLHRGEVPAEIDHIDGNRSNNRFDNLRSVEHADNMKNQRIHSTNTSGHVGVYKVVSSKGVKWRAKIHAHGRGKSLGTFLKKHDAIEAWSRASKQLGYHKNHGYRIGATATSMHGNREALS